MINALRYQLRMLRYDSQRLLNPMLTLIIVLILFGMILSQHKGLLAGEILITASYIILSLSLNSLFQDDIRSGFIEAYIAHGQSLEDWVVAKTLWFWLSHLIPLFVISWIFCHSMSIANIATILIVQTLASFIVVMLGSIGSVLILQAKQNSFLLPLLSLPIMLPSLLVSFAIVENSGHGSYLKILLGLCFVAVALSWSITPFAIRLILR